MSASPQVELVLDARAALGEGPIWHVGKQVLYWLDIFANEVHAYDPATGRDQVYNVGQPVGTVVARRSGGLMLALRDGFASYDPDTGELQAWHDPEPDLAGTRFNDGKCDPAGRFLAGTMSTNEIRGAGSLYCLDVDHTVRKVLGDVTVSNGLAWSADRRTMYYIDTPLRTVSAFDYDVASGGVSHRREVIHIPEGNGSPDGMTIDADDKLWVAFWGGAQVSRWDAKSGERLATIALPVTQTTACWFGGPALDELYITSARTSLDQAALAREPLAGGLFRVRPGVRGLPADEYLG